jgi:hypothetical protein
MIELNTACKGSELFPFLQGLSKKTGICLAVSWKMPTFARKKNEALYGIGCRRGFHDGMQ